MACSRSVRSLFAVVVVAVASCDSAITLEIAGDRPIPRALDAICVGIADTDEDGGHLGQLYPLTGELASLPQSLRVEPGDAGSAHFWVRGDRGGAPVAWASTRSDFSGSVRLPLERCPVGRAGAPSPSMPMGPADAKLVASHGSGNIVVAFAPTEAVIIDTTGATPGPPLGAGTFVAAVAIDVDGDCDDDLVVATSAEAPIVWRRGHRNFELGEPVGTGPQAALAAADIDRDGDMDLVTGGGASLSLWYNDGAGRFTFDDEDLRAAGRVANVRALALGDVDVDGDADLIVGQASQPLRAWLGGPSGAFEANDGVVPPAPLDVAELALADADGDPDLDPDLSVAVRNGPAKLYIDREGQLEDLSFVRLPRDPAPLRASAIAIGNWDDGRCEPDAIYAGDPETVLLRGGKEAFTKEGALAAASDVVMIDLDEDGDLDAVVSTVEGVRWLAR